MDDLTEAYQSMGEVTQDMVATTTKIIESMFSGEPLGRALESNQFKAMDFFMTLHTCGKLERAYAMAQQSKAELMVEEMSDIADTEADPMRARVRIDTRRWYAEKIKSHKYGAKLDVNINQTISLTTALEQARSRVIELPKQNFHRISPAKEIIDIFS